MHVPFRGLPESQTAVIRGDVAMAFTFFNVGGDLVQSGKMRGLAVTGTKRLAEPAERADLQGSGRAGLSYDAWFGILAPAGTPKAIVAKASRDIAEMLRLPMSRRASQPQGVELVSSRPRQVRRRDQGDAERYGKLVKPAGN